MQLRGLPFERVFNASGARGFRKEGYWFHRLGLGPDFTGSSFVAKTTTLAPREGNMPLHADNVPRDFFPDCIIVKPFKGVVLNAVGLSGPGIGQLIEGWRETPPDVVSVMSVAGTPEQRWGEIRQMTQSHLRRLVELHAGRFALQVNISCPNAGLDTSHLVEETDDILDTVGALGIPVTVKLNALVPPASAVKMAQHDACDAIVMSNTIPWGQLPDRIDWAGLFGGGDDSNPRGTSPLAKRGYGGGGLSGAPLLPIVCDWIRAVRKAGLKKPIVGGGGILSKAGADAMFDAGADAIELGSVAILRPWRVQGIINHVRAR
jgi:dihydroorotate dehydrogenase (NAD+) catalytic subunit